ncbi:MAG TPA: glycosyltransferase family 4 protein [Candidatus Eisenbacteria bacterium]|nr:glycosyltransferase family 4 protein [Candidatus Eisenbacteria bacterium]
MKVLLVSGLDLSLPGGVETHLRELARELTERGHEVAVYGSWSRREAGPPPPLVASVEPSRYDIVHHHGGRWDRSWDAGGRYLRTFHFSVAGKMSVYLRMGRLRTLLNPGNYRALADERASLRRGSRHIAVANGVRDELVRFHRADHRSLVVIPNGTRFAAPRVGRDEWRRRHGIGPETPVVLTIGRADFVKGLDLFERAWRMPGVRPPGALWVQAGGARPWRDESRIVTGTISPEDVNEWIHAADLGAFPSYYEGCSLALIDMLAGRLYVLSHAAGAAPEQIRTGENGEFVARRADAWAAALARCLAAPPRPTSVPSAEVHGWPAIAARVEGVYRALRGESA